MHDLHVDIACAQAFVRRALMGKVVPCRCSAFQVQLGHRSSRRRTVFPTQYRTSAAAMNRPHRDGEMDSHSCCGEMSVPNESRDLDAG